jgi:hypothetical protein
MRNFVREALKLQTFATSQQRGKLVIQHAVRAPRPPPLRLCPSSRAFIVKTRKSWRVASRAHQGRPGHSRAAAAARKGRVLDVPGRDQDPARPGGCLPWRLAWRSLASSHALQPRLLFPICLDTRIAMYSQLTYTNLPKLTDTELVQTRNQAIELTEV